MAGEARRRRLRALLEIAGVASEELEDIDAAFIHESAAREAGLTSNERLEFLGDAVLGTIVANWLYANYPADREGMLAKRKAALVSDRALAANAKRLGFGELVLVGAGERAHGGTERASTLADVFEAFIAALYRRFGMPAAQSFVEREHIAYVDHARADVADAKTQLQELSQERFACTPLYTEEAEGPAHERVFTATVSVAGERLGTGSGPSKKSAHQNAAAQALQTLQART
ncbi:MAG TPA: ribonuclease III [Candidatus Baltobacteraceae bacterium]|jgi:ribonuclease-3